MSILTKRRNTDFSRRNFLGSLGLAASAGPFLPLLNASGAEPTVGGRPKRLLLIYTPHGTVYDRWKPTGTDAAWQLNQINAPLEKWKSKINVFTGVNFPNKGVGAPHTKGLPLLFTGSQLAEDMTFSRPDGSGGKFFGWNTGPSLDQFLVQRLKPQTLYPSIEFGVRAGGNNNPAARMIYTGPAKPLVAESNPYAIFDRLFTKKGGDQLRAERKTAIDILKPELDALKVKVSSEDKDKIDAHLQTIRAIETRLAANAAGLCTGQTQPMGLQGAMMNANAIENSGWTMDRQLELISMAFACDVTRFASLQFTVGDNDSRPYPWLGIMEGHHDPLTHAGDSDMAAKDKMTKIYTWYHDRVAYLLDKLNAVPEGNGTLLDNTLVIWGSEVGKGNSHSYDNIPFITAGGAGGAVRTGRLLSANKAQHNRILVSACHAFGATDVTTFGNLDNATGPLPGLMV